MFGGLHIEMAAPKALGDLWDSSDIGQVHSYMPVLPHIGLQIRFWRHLTWHAPDVLIRSQLVACIYFSRRRTPSTAMVWKRGAIRCHWKTGVFRELKPVVSSCFGQLSCSWNWRWWSTWERYERETSCWNGRARSAWGVLDLYNCSRLVSGVQHPTNLQEMVYSYICLCFWLRNLDTKMTDLLEAVNV